MSEPPICEAFYKLAKLAEKDGIGPLNTLPGCWTRQIGKQWWIACNGHKQTMKAISQDGASQGDGVAVGPYQCYIEFNGWPAGFINPFGGAMAAGDAANEAAFIAAIDAEIAR